jgi:hypothetical protein
MQLFQQHLNTANKRHARARGLPIPSDATLTAAIHRRVEALPDEHYNQLARRYSRVGIPDKTSTSGAVSGVLADAKSNVRTGGSNGNKDKTVGTVATGAGVDAVGGATAGAVGSFSNSSAKASSNVDPNASGFSAVSAAAQQDDTLTVSKNPGTKAQLALDIELV